MRITRAHARTLTLTAPIIRRCCAPTTVARRFVSYRPAMKGAMNKPEVGGPLMSDSINEQRCERNGLPISGCAASEYDCAKSGVCAASQPEPATLRITTYGGGKTVQHWQLRYGDLFLADTSVQAHVEQWRQLVAAASTDHTDEPAPKYLPPPSEPPLRPSIEERQTKAWERIAVAAERLATTYERQARRG